MSNSDAEIKTARRTAANTGCFIVTVRTEALANRNPTSAETSHYSDHAHKHDKKKRAVDNGRFPLHRNLTTNTINKHKVRTKHANCNYRRTDWQFGSTESNLNKRQKRLRVRKGGLDAGRGGGGSDRKWAFSDVGQCVNTRVGGQPGTILSERHQKQDSLFHRYKSSTAKNL